MGKTFGDMTPEEYAEVVSDSGVAGVAEEAEVENTSNGAFNGSSVAPKVAEAITEQPKKYRYRMTIDARPYVKGESLENVGNTGFIDDDPEIRGYIAWPTEEPDLRAFIEAEEFNESFQEV